MIRSRTIPRLDDILNGNTKANRRDSGTITTLTRQFASREHPARAAQEDRDRAVLEHNYLTKSESRVLLEAIDQYNTALRKIAANPTKIDSDKPTLAANLKPAANHEKEFRIIRAKQNRCITALLEHNEQFIRRKTSPFFNHFLFPESNMSEADLLQEARFAFNRAALNFNLSRKLSFTTPAGKYIERECRKKLYRSTGIANVSSLQELYDAYYRAQDLYLLAHGQFPDDDELALAIGYGEIGADCFNTLHDDYSEFSTVVNVKCFYEPNETDDDASFPDRNPSLATTNPQNIDSCPFETQNQKHLDQIERLMYMVDLTPMEQVCLRLEFSLGVKGRYNFSNEKVERECQEIKVPRGTKMGPTEIGALIGVGKEPVRKAINSALYKLREFANGRDSRVINCGDMDELRSRFEYAYSKQATEMSFEEYVSWSLDQAISKDTFETPGLQISKGQAEILKLRLGISSPPHIVTKPQSVEEVARLLATQPIKRINPAREKIQKSETSALAHMTNAFREKPDGLIPDPVVVEDRDRVKRTKLKTALHKFNKKHAGLLKKERIKVAERKKAFKEQSQTKSLVS